MARMKPNLRQEFDRDQNYVAVRKFILAGTNYDPGDPVDKTQTTTRRLRQLYDQRIIEMVVSDQIAAPLPLQIMPDFYSMTEDELIEWYKQQSVVPRYGANPDKLISKAIEIWQTNVNAEPKQKVSV